MIHAELAWCWEKGRNNEDKVLVSTFGITQSHQSNKYENMKKGNIRQRSRKIWNMKYCFWRNNKHYLSTVTSQRKEMSKMEKGEILFLEPDFETLWTIVKSSMMDNIILTKKKWKWHQKFRLLIPLVHIFFLSKRSQLFSFWKRH